MVENTGVLRVLTNEDLDRQEAERIQAYEEREEMARRVASFEETNLINFIRTQWEIMRNHRSTSGLDERLLRAMRVFNGEYDNTKLAEIQKFGGSEVYSRIVAAKARGATALMRDIYFQQERPWALGSTPDPKVPDEIGDSIPRLVQAEAMSLMQQGIQFDPSMIQTRIKELQAAARAAAVENAQEEARRAEMILDDFLAEGGFYTAVAEFLVDLPLFPFACIKGPMVRMVPQVKWVNGNAVQQEAPKLVWSRVSPFDVYFTPGVSNIADADICERLRWTRKNLNDLIGLPGWDEEAVRGALREYDGGLRDWMDPVDSSRADHESREDPNFNRSNMIDAMEFHGAVQGSKLLELDFFDEETITDPDRDYMVEAWVCGQHVLKAQLSPSPRKRHPYFMTSFEKVPGTPVGNALPDMLADIEEVGNAALRSLVNNMAMASGPQVVVDMSRLSENESGADIYPWKRWFTSDERGMSTRQNPPVDFYQPTSNAQELLGIYNSMTQMADEISAIPRYITGSGATGGAGRTASGLSMLMGNASKLLQQVASNVDVDIFEDTLQQLFDLVMLTGAGSAPLRGDEKIVVKGAATVIAREAERARQLEFLGLTANPMDMQIMGMEGRAEVLRSISQDLGMPNAKIVPTRDELAERQRQAVEAQAKNAAAGAPPEEQAPGPAESDSPVMNTVQPGHNTT